MYDLIFSVPVIAVLIVSITVAKRGNVRCLFLFPRPLVSLTCLSRLFRSYYNVRRVITDQHLLFGTNYVGANNKATGCYNSRVSAIQESR